jgi:hypothetical protein
MTHQEKPREVFFSYARHDRALVEDVVRGLGRLNTNVWFDEALEGGQAWWDEIITRVQTCDVFVQAVSPAAVDSVACGRERGYAVALGKPVLPVIVEQMPVQQLPSDIARLQLVNCAMVGGAIQLTGRYVRLSNVWTWGDVLRLTVLAAVPAAIGGLIISGDVLAPESDFAVSALATVAFGVAGVGIGLGVASAYTGGIALFVLPLLGGMLPAALFRERTSISAVLVVGFVGIVLGAVIAIRFFARTPEVEPPR